MEENSATAAASLSSAHATVLERLAKMSQLDFPAALGFDSFELQDGVSGRIASFEAPKQNVAWCSHLSLSGGPPSNELFSSTIAVWNTPSVETPHFYSRLGISNSEIQLEIDFRHRLNAGYEAVQDCGTFLPPTSREEFAQASLRSTYDAAYFTSEARAWRSALLSTEGARPAPASSAGVRIEGRRQFGAAGSAVAGPLLVSLTLPLSDFGVETAVAASDSAAGLWLDWCSKAETASWMSQRMLYDRDCQVRQLCVQAAAEAYAERFGADGRALAIAEAGRLDMMGHNMMQENKGFGSDPDEGRD